MARGAKAWRLGADQGEKLVTVTVIAFAESKPGAAAFLGQIG
jgi:hypothetical protein